jgi:hypothetical protein
LGLSAAVVIALPAAADTSVKKKNPGSKIYVSDVSGDATIGTEDTLEDLSKRSVYTAQGTVIETKKSSDRERGRTYSTMVYSNGTGAFFDADTRVEVKRFNQEPFTPNRSDVEVEPSISQTQAFVARGVVGLCTSKLVAGSSMIYQTPHGSVQVRGRKVVIEANADVTKISMLEGESTIRGGPADVGGYTLRAGEQALIRRTLPGQPNEIQIGRIPPSEAPQLDDKVAMACMAKKTVYFEERIRKGDGTEIAAESTTSEAGADAAGANEPAGDGVVTAFDGTSNKGTVREIVPVELVPVTLPTEYTISPSVLTKP